MVLYTWIVDFLRSGRKVACLVMNWNLEFGLGVGALHCDSDYLIRIYYQRGKEGRKGKGRNAKLEVWVSYIRY